MKCAKRLLHQLIWICASRDRSKASKLNISTFCLFSCERLSVPRETGRMGFRRTFCSQLESTNLGFPPPLSFLLCCYQLTLAPVGVRCLSLARCMNATNWLCRRWMFAARLWPAVWMLFQAGLSSLWALSDNPQSAIRAGHNNPRSHQPNLPYPLQQRGWFIRIKHCSDFTNTHWGLFVTSIERSAWWYKML